MMIHTHQTAPTQFVEANGIRFAYRRFGRPSGVPLVFNQHYTGTMDHWDPAVTDGLAKDREVILFNNAGVSTSSGEVPATFADMGAKSARTDESRRARLFDRRLCRAGNHPAGSRSGQTPGFGRHRPAQRRRHGDPHSRGAENLRCHL